MASVMGFFWGFVAAAVWFVVARGEHWSGAVQVWGAFVVWPLVSGALQQSWRQAAERRQQAAIEEEERLRARVRYELAHPGEGVPETLR